MTLESPRAAREAGGDITADVQRRLLLDPTGKRSAEGAARRFLRSYIGDHDDRVAPVSGLPARTGWAVCVDVGDASPAKRSPSKHERARNVVNSLKASPTVPEAFVGPILTQRFRNTGGKLRSSR